MTTTPAIAAAAIRHQAPLWDWRRGHLARVGRAVRRETEVWRLRHRVVGRPGLLVSPHAMAMWSRGGLQRPEELIVVEGLTDYVALERIAPTMPLIGVPGKVDPRSLGLWRHVARRPQRVIILRHPDVAGGEIAQRIEEALWSIGVYRVAVASPKRGMDVAEALAWATQEDQDPMEAAGVLRGRRALRREGR